MISIKESALKNIMIEASTEVYLKPEKDFPIDEPRAYRIIDGKYVRALFNNKKIVCSSNDMLVGKLAADGTKQECQTCNKIDMCSINCRLILTTLMYGHIYYLNIPHSAQVSLSLYVEKLLLNNLDAPDVITKITRVKDGKFTTYRFELLTEWFTEEELSIIKPIVKEYTILNSDEREDFDIETMFKIKGFTSDKLTTIKLLLGHTNG